MKKVLIACEFSGMVRDEFIKLGFDAYSCDLLDTEIPGPHYKCDVREILNDDWDLIIAFPPCQYLCVSGMHWTKRGLRDPKLTESALQLVIDILNAPCNHIAVENPVGIISTRIRKPDQMIQPYQFYENASKKTCLWLKNLPKLIPTKMFPPKIINGKSIWGNQTKSGQNKLGPSVNRAKERSRTYPKIAEQMALQWHKYINNPYTL